MIEILELKNSDAKSSSGIPNDNLRRFIIREGNKTMGSIQFQRIHPQIAFLLKLEITDNSVLSVDVIADGLIRTACHTFQMENILLISADREVIEKDHLLTQYFTPLEKIAEVTSDETMTAFLHVHHQEYALKTDMIYQGCCKGV